MFSVKTTLEEGQCTWLLDNKLILNVVKTKVCADWNSENIASIPREPSMVVNCKLNEHIDKYCTSVEESLWTKHSTANNTYSIEEITLNMSRGLWALKCKRPNVQQPALVIIHNMNILPYFDCCSTV